MHTFKSCYWSCKNEYEFSGKTWYIWKSIRCELNLTSVHCWCRFYIGCDLCSNWYHGECVGITEKEAKKMDDYICSECKRAQEGSTEELYCICRTPYDESQYAVNTCSFITSSSNVDTCFLICSCLLLLQVLHRLRSLSELVPRALRGHPTERSHTYRRVCVPAVPVYRGCHDGPDAAHR